MERNIVSLLPGWEEAIDPSSGRTYYANRSTGEVTWLPPLSLPPPPPSLPPPPLSLTALPQQHNQHTTVISNSTNNAVIQSNINSTTATSNVSNTHHTSYATTTNTNTGQSNTTTANTTTQNNNNNNVTEKSAEEVSQLTLERFPIGYQRDNKKQLKEDAASFAKVNCFSVREEGRNKLVCTLANTSHEMNVASGKYQLSTDRARSTQCTNCDWHLHYSNRNKKVTIDRINSMHNHPLTASGLVISERKSGRAVSEAIRSCTDAIAPIILSREPFKCNLIRRIIKDRLHSSIVLDAETVGTIVRGVKHQIHIGNYTVPPTINVDVMQAFTSVDIASDNAKTVLEDLVRNADCELTWIVTQLMNRLKDQDRYFDFELHHDKHAQVDAVTWQTGPMRGGLEIDGDKAAFDTRNSDNMNTLRMRYASFTLQDGNHQILPASESFIFEEEHELFLFAIAATYRMAPNCNPESMKYGTADYFLCPVKIKTVLPNIILLLDEYHFLSSKNKTSILLKDFGPSVFGKIGGLFKKAFDADTKDACFVSTIPFVPLTYIIL